MASRGRRIDSIGWSGIGTWTLLIASTLAVAGIVGSSLNSHYYALRSADARRAFVPDPWGVAMAFLLSAGESAILCLIVCAGTARRLWRRLLIGLVVFVPWMFITWHQIATDVPGYVIFNALWVALIVTFLATRSFVVVVVHVWRRYS